MVRSKIRIRIVAIALLVAPFLVAVWGFGIEPGMLVVRHLRMELPGWKSDLRIAVLSDLHIGSPHVGLDKLRTIVEKTNAENPALVVLLGDFVIGGPNRPQRRARRRIRRAGTDCRRTEEAQRTYGRVSRCWAITTGGTTASAWGKR